MTTDSPTSAPDAAPSATASEPAATVRIPWRELPVVVIVALVFYLVTTTHNFCEAHDSITYINEIDNGIWFNAHHLLFRWLAGGFVWTVHLVAPNLDSALIVQGMNSLFAAGCLAVVYAFQRGILRLGVLPAALLTALPGFSYGFWYYSTAIEVYIVPLFFLLLSLLLLCRPDLRTRQMGWVGVFHGLSVLFHMVHGLFGLTIIAAMIARRKQPGFQPLRGFLIYLIVAFFVSTIPYGLVVAQRHQIGKDKTIADSVKWWKGYTQEDQFWNEVGASTLVKAGIGFSRSFVGSHFAFASGPVGDMAARVLRGRNLQDEQFLVRSMGATTATGLMLLAALTGAAVLFGSLWQLRRWRSIWREYPLALVVMAAWLVSYMGFFYFWEPDNVEFWIPQSVLLWMLASLIWVAGRGGAETADTAAPGTTRALSTPVVTAFGVAAVLLAAVNFGGSIRFLMSSDNDLYHARTVGLEEVAGPGDLVILDNAWIYGGYVIRYTGATVRGLRNDEYVGGSAEEKTAILTAIIAKTLDDGGRVVFHESVLAPNAAPDEHVQFAADFIAPYVEHWQRETAGAQAVYVLSADDSVATEVPPTSPPAD